MKHAESQSNQAIDQEDLKLINSSSAAEDCTNGILGIAAASPHPLRQLSRVIGGRSPGVLVNHPVGGGLLGVPGLEELFGEVAQLFGIFGTINHPVKPLNLKSLSKRQFDR
ncbi:MAG: hypothetical protein ACKO2W_02780 [Vulcanococcus sp.]